ncbi:MAG: MarR family winged helix-turn-helix transcriptional regulator [Rhodobacter sp.]|nr:MarR family winged helix-turn-helix transcriptional regulator [Rhodobacter sp.]
MPGFDLDAFLPYQLAVLSARVSRDFSAHYRERFGIGVAEWRVVANLSQVGTASVGDIHDRVDMDKSKVSRAASRLEAAGYISKAPHPTDGRLVALTLTDKGRAMIRDLAPVAKRFEAEVLAGLGDQAPAFRSALQCLLKASDAVES